jgi:hypothetical protein
MGGRSKHHHAKPSPNWPGRVIEVPGGQAYIGPGAETQEDSVGPGAILLRCSSVSPGALVRGAVVWPGETVPTRSHLEDCVWFRGEMYR